MEYCGDMVTCRCTAGATTALLEFGTLTALTGDTRFLRKAHCAVLALHGRRSKSTGLVGSTIDIQTGSWLNPMSGLGAGVDSYYEYLFKAYELFGTQRYLSMFEKAYAAIIKHHLSRLPLGLAVNVHMETLDVSNHWVDSLGAFFPGLQVLYGDISGAVASHEVYFAIWRKYAAMPERWNWASKNAEIPLYPLRPEFAESTYLLYRATKDDYYLRVGVKILEGIAKHSTAKCGCTSDRHFSCILYSSACVDSPSHSRRCNSA
eukprot:SAG31_NODE_1156_length_9616_cov_26.963014_4_plen_262_part_00